MNFIPQYSMNSRENSVGVHVGTDMVHVSKCGACRITWMHDVCQNNTRGVSGRYESAKCWHGSSGHCDMWSVTCWDTWMCKDRWWQCGYECRDTWVAWGRWQMWEEGCWDTGMCVDGELQMCLVQGVTEGKQEYPTQFRLLKGKISTGALSR